LMLYISLLVKLLSSLSLRITNLNLGVILVLQLNYLEFLQ